jgi:DNA replication licensing factor MCM5
VNRLLLVPGIVINSSRTKPKAVSLHIRCSGCNAERELPCPAGFAGASLPRTCTNLCVWVVRTRVMSLYNGAGMVSSLFRAHRPTHLSTTPFLTHPPHYRSTASEENGGAAPPADRKCPLDPFVIIPDRSSFIDTQTLKLQEAPEQVPTGEMPRHLLLAAERSLTDKIAPGTRVSVIGVASIFSSAGQGAGSARASAVSVRTPYLRVVGVMVHEEGSGRVVTEFSPEEEARMREMAKQPGLYQVRWREWEWGREEWGGGEGEGMGG